MQASTSRGTLETEKKTLSECWFYYVFLIDLLSSDFVDGAWQVCKVTVAEMAKSAERAIDGLRSRYNISATLA